YSESVNENKGVDLNAGSSPGCVTVDDLTLIGTSTLTIEIDGLTACTEYDQWTVTNTVTLGGATLTLVATNTFTTGSVITILDKLSTGVITSTFAGGPSYYDGTNYWLISYTGGGGNDVTLTVGTPPTKILCPSNITRSTPTSGCARAVSYTVTFAGSPTPDITYVFTGATVDNGSGTGSGETFNKGITDVEVTATNVHGTVTCSFSITIVDDVPPMIVYSQGPPIEACPPNVTVNTLVGQCGNYAGWTAPTASDNCPGVSLTSSHFPIGSANPTFFPVGVTLVTYTATDASGNITTCTFTVTVVDNQLPALTGIPYTDPAYYDDCYIDATTPPLGVPAFNATNALFGYTDNCGIATATLTSTVVTGNDCAWTVTYTYSAIDVNSNALTGQSYTHSGGDKTTPTWTVEPVNLTVECDGFGNVTDLNTWLAAPTGGDACGVATVTHNYTALSDLCGATG
ncbi:MAG: HYR domain-containing protein, partial [Actinomycetota bacterium]|nr:HYR domain-containing protein [Actinomycetota bacterium]